MKPAIRDVMTTPLRGIEPDRILKDAAALMRDMDVGCLPVIESENVVGFITDRDLVIRAGARGQQFANTSVREVMTEDVIDCYDDQSINDALLVMKQHQVRRVIVKDHDDRPIGIVTMRDVALQAARNEDDRSPGEVLEELTPIFSE